MPLSSFSSLSGVACVWAHLFFSFGPLWITWFTFNKLLFWSFSPSFIFRPITWHCSNEVRFVIVQLSVEMAISGREERWNTQTLSQRWFIEKYWEKKWWRNTEQICSASVKASFWPQWTGRNSNITKAGHNMKRSALGSTEQVAHTNKLLLSHTVSGSLALWFP